MDSLWEKVKQGFIMAAERTDELTRIGRLKLDIAATHRKIRQNFEELGGRTYEFSKPGKKSKKALTDNEDIQRIIKAIGNLEKQLSKEEKQLSKLQKKT
jgi:hypothetical protein